MNPLELNDLYDQLWQVGVVLQGDDPLSVLEHRTWPQMRQDCTKCREFYAKLNVDSEEKKSALRLQPDREDAIAYQEVLHDVLKLFGEGIHESLMRTMGAYINATDGEKRNNKLTELEKTKASQLLSHNNHAERPFAVIKALAKKYPSMSLRNLAATANARVNGTFRMPEEGGKTQKTIGKIVAQPGIFYNVDPELLAAVSKVCSVRENTVGVVVAMIRDDYENDMDAQRQHRKAQKEFKLKETTRLQKGRAEKANIASEVKLAISIDEFKLHLRSLEGLVGAVRAKRAYLKGQFDARVHHRKWEYPISAVGLMYRNKSGKALRKTSNEPGKKDDQHLLELLELMIAHDAEVGRGVQVQEEPVNIDLVRVLPTISPAHTNARSLAWKKELVSRREAASAPTDDQYLLLLEDRYKDRLFFDFEDAMATYRVDAISYVPNDAPNNPNPPAWEATCVEVFKTTGGEWAPKESDVVTDGCGREIVKANSYIGYTLAELFDPDSPTPRDSRLGRPVYC